MRDCGVAVHGQDPARHEGPEEGAQAGEAGRDQGKAEVDFLPCDHGRDGDAVAAAVKEVEVRDGRGNGECDDNQSEHVHEYHDSLLRGLELVLADEPDGHGEDNQLSQAVPDGDDRPTSRLPVRLVSVCNQLTHLPQRFSHLTFASQTASTRATKVSSGRHPAELRRIPAIPYSTIMAYAMLKRTFSL